MGSDDSKRGRRELHQDKEVIFKNNNIHLALEYWKSCQMFPISVAKGIGKK